MAKRKPAESALQPVIRYAPLGQPNVYQVYEHELDALAQGGQGSLFLNFALFLLGVAVTVIATLWSTTIPSDRVYTTFVLVALVTGIAGVVLFALWWKTHQSSTNLITLIKIRMPPAEPIEQLSPASVEVAPAPTPPSVSPPNTEDKAG